ncbi:MAG TPA: baseplate J/gp47 family protein [Pseudonocardiaceae bacterium]|nr:baseplate J/gp47 family protein [Pseudonocardiaceae bacterium]
MSTPLNRPPVDLGSYVDLRIFDVPSQDLVDAMITMYGISNPSWIPREGNTELVLMEAIALGVAENVVAINRLPGAVVEAVLQLAGVFKDFGAPATATATITLADGLGYTIPTGTRFYLPLANGTVVFLSQAPDVQIASGQTSATINLISQINTAAANGVLAPARLVLADQLNMVQTVVLASTVAGGRDPETDAEWRDRGVAAFKRLSSTLVTPNQFNAAVDEDPRIGRVMTIDLWDASGSTPGTVPGHITSAVLDPTGLALASGVLTDIQATIQAQAAAMLVVHVINATLDTINVVATIRTAAGYTPATVAASVVATIRNYVNPLTWAAGGVLRHNEFVSVIDQVLGVDWVGTVTLNASSGDVSASAPKALPQAGTVTITEAP